METSKPTGFIVSEVPLGELKDFCGVWVWGSNLSCPLLGFSTSHKNGAQGV